MSDNKILKIFGWYRDAMRSVANRKVSWPEAKDYTKTYLYMWLSKLKKWADRNELDDTTLSEVIYALVRYGMRHKILFKGSAILQHERIYEIALNEIEQHISETKGDLYKIKSSEDALNKLRENKNKFEFLIKRPGIGKLPNIVTMYNAGVLSPIYFAVSKSCRKAINKLDDRTRSLLPKNIDLLRMQKRISFDKSKSNAVRKLLGDDYLK